MNKSLLTNLLSFLLCVLAYWQGLDLWFSVGLFALSGALTNWLAVHMLFERVPGLYGSGVIPARFEELKQGIRALMMGEFFSDENIDRFLSDAGGAPRHYDISAALERTDFSPAFEALVAAVMHSSLGGMLGMFGGEKALESLREPFVAKLKQAMVDISQSDAFCDMLREQLESPEVLSGVREKIQAIIDRRLAELTPAAVKRIIQQMIRQHLGWLVVWGGVFGGLIGLLAGLLQGA